MGSEIGSSLNSDGPEPARPVRWPSRTLNFEGFNSHRGTEVTHEDLGKPPDPNKRSQPDHCLSMSFHKVRLLSKVCKRPRFPSEASGEVLLEVSTYFVAVEKLATVLLRWANLSLSSVSL
jgi:hypothetical protein